MALSNLEKVLNDPGTFINGPEARLVESSSKGTYRRVRPVPEDCLLNYIENDFQDPSNGSSSSEDHDEEHLNVTTQKSGYDSCWLPISTPFTPSTFRRLTASARSPKLLLEVMAGKTGVYFRSRPELPTNVQHATSPESLDKEYLSFIIGSTPCDRASNATASYTYHFPTRRMYSYFHGSENHGEWNMSDGPGQGGPIETYFLLPALIVKKSLEDLGTTLLSRQSYIYNIEQRLALRYEHRHVVASLPPVDYSEISQLLNGVVGDLAFCMWECKNNRRLLEFLDSIAHQYHRQAIINKIPESRAIKVRDTLLETHEYLKSWTAGLEARAEYLQKREDAPFQTVYSGIAQRDAATSRDLAAANTKIASISQEVAVASSRDSAVMRTITGITMFFLPATFTATFFSTSFFDFKRAPDGAATAAGQVYSPWLWLYFTVTSILTAVVVTSSWVMWRNKEKEIALKFGSQTLEPTSK